MLLFLYWKIISSECWEKIKYTNRIEMKWNHDKLFKSTKVHIKKILCKMHDKIEITRNEKNSYDCKHYSWVYIWIE